MGTLETKSQNRRKKRDLQKLILDTVAVTGAVSVALIAPNAIGAMKKLNLLPSPRQEESIRRARNQLVQKGFLKRDKRNFLCLTERGRAALDKINALKHGLPKPKKWDGKWRILIFDIPHYRKSLREKVRRALRAAGFVLFQKSVWVFPYNCENFIALLKADFKIGKDMRYIIADTIENDLALRETFGLRSTPHYK